MQTRTPEQRKIIFGGLSVTQLADLFEMKRQSVERKIAGIQPCGYGRMRAPLYQVREVAPRLVKVVLTDAQIRETLQRADPKDFPPIVNKMFWEGLAQRRKYEELTNELWHTSDVVAVAAAAFNVIRMSLLLLPDDLSDTAGLNERQRGIVQSGVDTMLESLRDALIDELRKPSRSGPEPADEDGEL